MLRHRFIFGLIAAILTSGCATAGAGYRASDVIASQYCFKKESIKTNLCTITSFHNFTRPGASLTVYIEGDGMSWRSRRELSEDPTPHDPLVLSLAVIDPSENVAYIARPGQLTLSARPDCDPSYWSEKRFSAEVVSAMNSAIEYLKGESRSREVNLIGYSGGAAIAAMIAAQRNDVASLRTIAGNLDPEAVNLYHRVSPMKGSLNPMEHSAKIAYIPQRHFAAENDHIIPLDVTRSFTLKAGDKEGKSITVVKGTTHFSGWKKAWPALLDLSLYKQDNK